MSNKNLVIVAEVCMPLELGLAGIYGGLSVKNVRAAIEEPIPGMHETSLTPEPIPDTGALAQQIGLAG
ncbi:MAG TPA: hypothetical protein VFC50_00480 [Candidatus Dormibacteraeota bacterium]|nr:hypothetical protein [Candidatus Dormibacteraeota bacterium]